MQKLFEKISEYRQLIKTEAAKQLVLVIPAQASLSIEKEVFEYFKEDGFFDIRIVRGQKLMDEILNDTKRPKETAITTVGRNMILRKTSKMVQDDLLNYSSVCNSSEFIDLAADFVLNLKQRSVSSSDILNITSDLQGNDLLKAKLHDMRLIYDKYSEFMEGKFSDSEDLLSFVTDRIKESDFIKNSLIIFYGFYSFTAQELIYLSALSKYSKALCVALSLGEDKAYDIVRDTKQKLSDRNIETISCTIRDPYKTLKTRPTVLKCANPYSQALSIAADIKRHIRQDDISYEDIAIFVSQNSEMQNHIKRIFSHLDIPLFVDEKKTILHSSAVEALSSIFDMLCNDFRRSDVIRFFKSHILTYDENDIDLFDNYTKTYHIKSSDFFKEFRYGKQKYTNEEFALLEKMRSDFENCIKEFYEDFEAKNTVKEKTLCLYTFLDEKIDLPNLLKDISMLQAENGFTDAAEENAQIWDDLVSVMQQMIELLGDELQSTEEYSDTFKNALKDIRVGVLPQAEGKVILGSIGRSYVFEKKLVYIAGFNDGLVPSDHGSNQILTDSEIKYLKKNEIDFLRDYDSLFEEEIYNIQKILSSAKDHLCISYCLSSGDGSELKQSMLLPSIIKKSDAAVEDDISSRNDETLYLEGYKLADLKLSQTMREYLDGTQPADLWKAVYNIRKDSIPSVKHGLSFISGNDKIDSDTAKSLFAPSGEYSFSPSRMDKFAACPFRHFVNYGLHPNELKDFSVGSEQIGTVYHDILLKLCAILSEKSKKDGIGITDPNSLWMTVSDNEVEQIIGGIINDLSQNSYDGVLLVTKEDEYKTNRIKKTALRFAKHMIDQVRCSVINEMYFEEEFKRGHKLPPICINTAAGKVYIEGRIDRIDVSVKNDEPYIRIIDYKSGNTKFNNKLVSQGLQLQLMTYLLGANGKFQSEKDAGVYYFHISDPAVAASLEELPADEISEKVLEKINKEYKLDGKDVDKQFREEFQGILNSLCNDLTSGNIKAAPKKIGSSYDSCQYCDYKSICLKEVK